MSSEQSDVILIGDGDWFEPKITNPQAYVLIDAYEALNLLEALDVVPDTGDWHAQMKRKLALAVADERVRNHVPVPNMSADLQREQIKERSS